MKHDFAHFVFLLIFTACATIATGLVLAVCISELFHAGVFRDVQGILLSAVVVITFGSAASMLHLGRAGRAFRSILGLRTSWLSREVILGGGFFACTIAAWWAVNVQAEIIDIMLLVLASLTGVALLLTIGLLYNFETQLAWRGVANIASPLVAAVLLAIFFLVFEAGAFQLNIVFFGFWTVDLLLFIFRCGTYLRLRKKPEAFVFGGLQAFVLSVYTLRFAASVVLMGFIYFAYYAVVPFVISAAIFMDRIIFYAASAGRTPSAEIKILKTGRMESAS